MTQTKILFIALLLSTAAPSLFGGEGDVRRDPLEEVGPQGDLWRAAVFGDTDGVERALKSGAEIDKKAASGNTALMMAVVADNLGVVRLLLDKGSGIDTQEDEAGFTALIYAVDLGYLEMIKLLLSENADVDMQNDDGLTALMWAVEKGYLKIVKLLLRKGSEVSIQDKYGETALMKAVEGNHSEVVRLLLELGADITKQDEDGQTAWKLAHDKPRIQKTIKDFVKRQKEVATALMEAREELSPDPAKIISEFAVGAEE